ncbi:MAG: hypothetical protein ACF8NJ_05980 [Phycisphaerales bacterium JB038]
MVNWLYGLSASALWITPLGLLALKIVQVVREDVILPKSLSSFGLALHTFARRVDDPSFWAILAAAVGASLVLRVRREIHRSRLVARFEEDWRENHVMLWAISSGALTTVYLVGVFLKGEAFFFEYDMKASSEPFINDHLIVRVQSAEGWMNVLVLWAATPFLVLGLKEARALLPILRVRLTRNEFDEPLCRMFTFLMLAAFGPATLGYSAWFWKNNLTQWTGWVTDPFYPWGPLIALPSMLLMLWPFLLLGIMLWIETSRHHGPKAASVVWTPYRIEFSRLLPKRVREQPRLDGVFTAFDLLTTIAVGFWFRLRWKPPPSHGNGEDGDVGKGLEVSLGEHGD